MRRTTNAWCLLACALAVAALGAGRKPAPTPVPAPAGMSSPGAGGAEGNTSVVVNQTVAMKPNDKGAARELREAQEAIGDLEADFAMTVSGAGPGGKDLVARGKAWMAAGRRYKVEYQEPDVQQLVSNGSRRWLYLEKINQVQVGSLPAAGDAGELFLELGGGLASLLSRCEVRALAPDAKRPRERGFEIIPKPDSGLAFKQARLWLDGSQLAPSRIAVSAEREVAVEFRNVKIHTQEDLLRDPESGLPADWFEFKPPAGAEVIDLF
ncbi:MAG: outer-membrane lipoprotein carrier protein LolA [candidate division FCPU426 bacterium]